MKVVEKIITGIEASTYTSDFRGADIFPSIIRLCPVQQVIVDCFSKLVEPVYTECNFIPSSLFLPVFPAVSSNVVELLFSIIILHHLNRLPRTISMKTGICCDIILDIELVNFGVQPVEFIHNILAPVWLRPIC